MTDHSRIPIRTLSMHAKGAVSEEEALIYLSLLTGNNIDVLNQLSEKLFGVSFLFSF